MHTDTTSIFKEPNSHIPFLSLLTGPHYPLPSADFLTSKHVEKVLYYVHNLHYCTMPTTHSAHRDSSSLHGLQLLNGTSSVFILLLKTHAQGLLLCLFRLLGLQLVSPNSSSAEDNVKSNASCFIHNGGQASHTLCHLLWPNTDFTAHCSMGSLLPTLSKTEQASPLLCSH